MAMTGVIRPGHVALRVLDVEKAVHHYTRVLGLIETGRDDQGRVYLKAWDEHDHHSVVLRKADSPGMDYMGFVVDSPDTLRDLAGKLEASPLISDQRWIAAGEHLHTGARFRFTVPTGHAIEIFCDKDKVGNGLVIEDWFEMFVAQNLAIDGQLYPLVYGSLVEGDFAGRGGIALSMLTGFMRDWHAETARWVDAQIKTAVGESEANKALVQGWLERYRGRARDALAVVARRASPAQADAMLDDCDSQFRTRIAKLGLSV